MRTPIIIAALGVAACASGPVQLPPGVKTSGQYIDRVEARYPGSATTADAQKCAALELTNPDVLITGTAGGVLRPGLPTAQVLQGGGVVQQVGDDFVIARGAAEYSVLGGVTSCVVRFSIVTRALASVNAPLRPDGTLDLTHRFFRDDLIDGLAAIRDLGLETGLDMPMIDAVLKWGWTQLEPNERHCALTHAH